MRDTVRGSTATRARGAAPVTVFVVLMLAVTGAAVALDGLPRWIAVAVVVVVTVAVTARVSIAGLGVGLTFVAVLCAPWNAVVVAGLRPSDAALAAAVACLLIAGRGDRAAAPVIAPAWLVLLVGAVVAQLAGHELLPTSKAYLAHRVVVDAIGAATTSSQTNVGIGARWLVSLIGVPLMILLAARRRPGVLGPLAMTYTVGAAISGAVAVSDGLGLTAISARFVVPDFGGRQAGLTVQANHLAATACLAMPFACWALARGPRRLRVLAGVCVVLLLAAEYESGSRGGAICILLAAALSVVLIRGLRTRLPFLVAGLFAATFLFFGMFPDVLAQLASSVRLANGAGVVGSDQVRAVLGNQGWADFRHQPFVGVGLQVALDAHNIYRQLLASGGIALFTVFVVFAVGALRAAVIAGRRDGLALAAGASIAAWLLFGMVENLLTDRFLYVPVGIVVACLQPAMSSSAAAASSSAPVPDPATREPVPS